MRYWLFMLGGLFVAGASIVLIDNGLFHLVRTGSCGSNGTYVSYRPCPPGTGAHILSLIGGIFGALIGIGLYAARGKRAGTVASIGFGLIMWSLLFVTIAGSVAYAAYGPGNTDNSGAKTTAVILGVIFIPMGLAPLLLALGGRRKHAQFVQLSNAATTPVYAPPYPRSHTPSYPPPTRPPVATAGPPPPAAAGSDDDPLEKIAALGKLRDRGLVTPEEFEAQKKRLLDEI
jgi:hypothetical protein